jgi:hypothetical protein
VLAETYEVVAYEDVLDINALIEAVQPSDILMTVKHTVPHCVLGQIQYHKVPPAASAFDMANWFVQKVLSLPALTPSA